MTKIIKFLKIKNETSQLENRGTKSVNLRKLENKNYILI